MIGGAHTCLLFVAEIDRGCVSVSCPDWGTVYVCANFLVSEFIIFIVFGSLHLTTDHVLTDHSLTV